MCAIPPAHLGLSPFLAPVGRPRTPRTVTNVGPHFSFFLLDPLYGVLSTPRALLLDVIALVAGLTVLALLASRAADPLDE